MPLSITKTERVETKHALLVGGVDLIRALNIAMETKDNPGRIPETARVFIRVPSGGDWSGTNLDMDDVPVEICWTTVEEH